jgi:hypothetical protein
MTYDVFISHASEDKDTVARPLAMALEHLELKVWLDEFELTLGDSLRRNIDLGLRTSTFGVVILSPAFFRKEWPQKELDGLVARERNDVKVILPVWHEMTHADVLSYSPVLADKIAVSTSNGIDVVAQKVAAAVRKATQQGPTAEAVPQVPPVEVRHEQLKRIREQSLMARNTFELRQSLYDVEAFLHGNPSDREARQLRDGILKGIAVEELRPAPKEVAHSLGSRNRTLAVWLSVLLGLAVTALVEYRQGFRPEATVPAEPAQPPAPAAAQARPLRGVIAFKSEPGDYIGQGKTERFTHTDGKLSATVDASRNTLTVYFHGDDHWSLDFAAPEGKRLEVGRYESAQRAAFHNPVKPGLDVSGAARGCNTLSGRFTIKEIAFADDNTLQRFVAEFEQRCEETGPPLRGSIDVTAEGS